MPTIRLSTNHLDRRRAALGGLVALTAVLQVAAAVGMAYVAGFSEIWRVLGRVEWYWLVVVVASLAVSVVGYHYAARGIYEHAEGPGLGPKQRRSATIAGFGGFLAQGGSALDKYALRAAGADETDADIRVTALAGLEHGVLAILGTAAGIAVLAAALPAPPPDFSVPWAVIPVPGFAIAFWLAGRYESRFDAQKGWRRKLGVFLHCIMFIRHLFRRPLRPPPAVLGMAVFWGAEMFAAWAGMAAFGFQMNAAQLILGVGTGMVFTRRTGPLAGAGIIMLTLPPSLYYSGAPLAVAVVGSFAYRVLSVWLPMPIALSQLPRLRAMGEPGTEHAPESAAAPEEPALPDGGGS